jgi:hypothetical protein
MNVNSWWYGLSAGPCWARLGPCWWGPFGLLFGPFPFVLVPFGTVSVWPYYREFVTRSQVCLYFLVVIAACMVASSLRIERQVRG